MWTRDVYLGGSRTLAALAAVVLLADPDLLGQLACLWRSAGQGTLPIESAAWVVDAPDGRATLVPWNGDGGSHHASWRGEIPEGARRVVHTHPRGDTERPSAGDRTAARALGLPVTVVTRAGLWSALPDGDVTREEGDDWLSRAAPCSCASRPQNATRAPMRSERGSRRPVAFP